MKEQHRPSRPPLVIIVTLVAVLLLSLVGAASAAGLGSPSAAPKCGALDWNNPNWPFCVAGADAPRGNGRPPVTIPPLPSVVATGISTDIRCERLGNSGNLRCSINGRSFVIPSPRGIIVRCSNVNGVLTCTFTLPGGATATPGETVTAAPPTPVETSTAGPTETMVMPSETATMVLPTDTATAGIPETTTAGPITTATVIIPPPSTTAAPGDTATAIATTTTTSAPIDTATAVPPDGLQARRLELLTLINQARAREGLPAMALDDEASTAAQDYAAVVASRQIGENTDLHSVDGTQFGDRLRAAGCQWMTAGENIIAGQGGPTTALDAMYGQDGTDDGRGGWMGSPGHRATILNGAFLRLGVGYVATGSRTYDHVWVTEHADRC